MADIETLARESGEADVVTGTSRDLAAGLAVPAAGLGVPAGLAVPAEPAAGADGPPGTGTPGTGPPGSPPPGRRPRLPRELVLRALI